MHSAPHIPNRPNTPAPSTSIPFVLRLKYALHCAGIHTGTLEVNHAPERPLSSDQRPRYGFASLALYREDEAAPRDETLTIRFQRHVLARDERPPSNIISHPRFDYGPHAWSCFYRPTVLPPTIHLPAGGKLEKLTVAVAALDRLMSAHEVAAGFRSGPRVACSLMLFLLALESQNIHIDVYHNINGSRWTEDEVLAHPDRFKPAVATQFLRNFVDHQQAPRVQ